MTVPFWSLELEIRWCLKLGNFRDPSVAPWLNILGRSGVEDCEDLTRKL
jgi:hypothetical protein